MKSKMDYDGGNTKDRTRRLPLCIPVKGIREEGEHNRAHSIRRLKDGAQGGTVMQITVCVGSSCHIKGSGQIVDQLLSLIAERKLKDRIELEGSFCLGNCMNGVCVQIDGEVFSLQPEDTIKFFETEILGRL
jgi:hypothetical protein